MSLKIHCREHLSINGRKKTFFEIINGGETIMSIEYDEKIATARVQHADVRRLFILDKVGKVPARIVLKNEYGFEIAGIYPSNNDTAHGIIMVEKDKFSYTLSHDNEMHINIGKILGNEPHLHCILDKGFSSISTSSHNHQLPAMLSALLLCMCWFWQWLNVPEPSLQLA